MTSFEKLTKKTIFVIPGVNKDLGNRLKNDGYDMVFLIYSNINI
jgi:hypothetical protein